MQRSVKINSIKIIYNGVFRVKASDGVDLTPKGAKACAILALLGDAPDLVRSRRWLESILWSDRSPKQANGSFRQALREIRTALGDLNDIVIANRKTISFDPKRVATDLTDLTEQIDRGELLEGLEVNDQEFENWLRLFRMRYDTLETSIKHPAVSLNKSSGLVIINNPEGSQHSSLDGLSHFVGDKISSNLSDYYHSVRKSNKVASMTAPQNSDVIVSTDIRRFDEFKTVSVEICLAQSGEVVFSTSRDFHDFKTVFNKGGLIDQLSSEAVDRATANIVLGQENLNDQVRALARKDLAIGKMFTFTPAGLAEASSLLDQCYELDKCGQFLAWQALLKMVEEIETPLVSVDNKIQARELCAKALELSPENGFVQSLVAVVYAMYFEDPETAHELAQRAFENKIGTAFSAQALSVSNMITGNSGEAYKLSKVSQLAAQNSRFRHWWDLYNCLASIANKRLDEAIASAEHAQKLSPSFKPATRQLVALYANNGDRDNFDKQLSYLKLLEPTLTLDIFTEDESYPVNTLRRAGMLDFKI